MKTMTFSLILENFYCNYITPKADKRTSLPLITLARLSDRLRGVGSAVDLAGYSAPRPAEFEEQVDAVFLEPVAAEQIERHVSPERQRLDIYFDVGDPRHSRAEPVARALCRRHSVKLGRATVQLALEPPELRGKPPDLAVDVSQFFYGDTAYLPLPPPRRERYIFARKKF